jgi:hypothetical protein
MIPVLVFKTNRQALAWAEIISKAKKHKMSEMESKYYIKAFALLGVNGGRANLLTQAMTQIIVPESMGGKTESRNVRSQNTAQTNK